MEKRLRNHIQAGAQVNIQTAAAAAEAEAVDDDEEESHSLRDNHYNNNNHYLQNGEREVIKIQSLIRCFLVKRRYKKSYKSLQRQRALLQHAKRLAAVLVIQCTFRCYHARQRVIQQRAILAEKEQERREIEELEQMIDGLHESFMTELMVIRAQTAIRGRLARLEFVEKVRKYRSEMDKQEEQQRNHAARQIQARIRGILGRRKFKKLLPSLKQARRMRSLCVECEIKPALRRCRQCKDQFCVDCYERIHRKGKRKEHSWTVLTPDAHALGMAYETKEEKVQSKPGDWEEFYDNTAKAKYWFNQQTGEASWINPYQ